MAPALIILALWVALLAPGVVRWLRNHKPSTSVASFHRQLRGLEHTGPKLMEPAYRLEGEDERLTEWVAPAAPPVVPRLVLLSSGGPQKESTMRHHRPDAYDDRFDDPSGDAEGYDDPPAWDDPWGRAEPLRATRSQRTVRSPRHDEYEDDDPYQDDAPVPVLSPVRARARRTRILAGLGAAVVASFVFGLLPGLTILWAVTLIGVVALVGYLCLMFYASNAGMFGNDTLARVTPVARSVVTPYADRRTRYDDEGWEPERAAAAR